MSEVKLSLARLKVKIDISDPELMTFINLARHEVQRLTHDIRPEWYGKVLEVNVSETFDDSSTVLATYSNLEIKAATESLPSDLIDVYAVVCTYADILDDLNNPIIAEARYANKEEFYSTQMHAWTVPSIERPLYTIETNRGTGTKEISLALPTTVWDNTTVDLKIYYTAVVPYLEELNTGTGTQDEENTIPIWCDEMIVKHATYYALKQTEDETLAKILKADIDLAKALYLTNNEIKLLNWNVMIPSKEGY